MQQTKRQVFYSFHYKQDSWRTAQVRSIGAVEGSKPVSDNEWEEIANKGDEAIKSWINGQIKYRSCTVVLVGSETASREWVKYEIQHSWNNNKGVVGIRIHGLENQDKKTSQRGENPFDHISIGGGKKLSSVVKCYDPVGSNSKEKYAWIKENIASIVDEAVRIRKEN